MPLRYSSFRDVVGADGYEAAIIDLEFCQDVAAEAFGDTPIAL